MSMKSALLSACAAAALLSTAQAAPVTWGVNGHQYEVVAVEGISWTAANAAATALGAGWHLVTITSAQEEAFVESLLSLSVANRSHYWIGANDSAVEGTFGWVTSETFSYTNWWGGEPNNAGGEDFAALDLRGNAWGWNDAPDDLGVTFGFARGYVLERGTNGNAVPEPGALSLLGLAALAAGLVSSRRRA